MQSDRYQRVLCLFTSLALCFALSSCGQKPDWQNGNRFVIGWQTAWAPPGLIAQTLMHTDIAQKHNLVLDFRGFVTGVEMNEYALTGQMNCLDTGSIPTITLLAHSDEWKIIGRLILNPHGVFAGHRSNIQCVDDLKGKSIGLLFGSGPHPYVLRLLKEHHLQVGDGPGQVKLININASEQVMSLQQGLVDAIATWDPQTSIAIAKHLGTVIDEENNVGVILVSKRFADEHPDSVVRLLECFIQADYFVAQQLALTQHWFAQSSGMNEKLLSHIKITEPNFYAKRLGDVSLDLTEEQIDRIQKLSDIMLEGQLIRRPVKIKDYIDASYLAKAKAQMTESSEARSAVSILQP